MGWTAVVQDLGYTGDPMSPTDFHSLDSFEGVEPSLMSLLLPGATWGSGLEDTDLDANCGFVGNLLFAVVAAPLLLPLWIVEWIVERVDWLSLSQNFKYWVGWRDRPAWRDYCRTEKCRREDEEWRARWREECRERRDRRALMGAYEI